MEGRIVPANSRLIFEKNRPTTWRKATAAERPLKATKRAKRVDDEEGAAS